MGGGGSGNHAGRQDTRFTHLFESAVVLIEAGSELPDRSLFIFVYKSHLIIGLCTGCVEGGEGRGTRWNVWVLMQMETRL